MQANMLHRQIVMLVFYQTTLFFILYDTEKVTLTQANDSCINGPKFLIENYFLADHVLKKIGDMYSKTRLILGVRN